MNKCGDLSCSQGDGVIPQQEPDTNYSQENERTMWKKTKKECFKINESGLHVYKL